MYIYAGIDEAGYGPMFGPLVIGCVAFAINEQQDDSAPPDLWQLLNRAVSKKPSKRQLSIAVNDSKKLYSTAIGLRHLERAALTFAQLAGHHPTTLCDWLNIVTPPNDMPADPLPWYQPTNNPIPTASTATQIDIASNVLKLSAKQTHVTLPHLSVTPVFENRFNEMTTATRSKAAVNFTFIAKHLTTIWTQFSKHHPTVIIDRQSGRTHYRELLSTTFPGTQLTILDETPDISTYHIRSSQHPDQDSYPHSMTVTFQTKADEHHLPTALASILAKYTRELLMERFNAYFSSRIPNLKPTAGYATDGKRFWNDLKPLLTDLSIDPSTLRRVR